MTQIQNTTPPWPTITDDDGSGKTGTKLNKPTFWDVIRDAINSLIHSTTNPTVTPAQTTDEVVTARGSMGSLDGRLDVSLNEDGTPKPNSAYTTLSEYQNGVGARNLVYNGDLDDWTAGVGAAPDGFVLTGVGATIAQWSTLGAGRYAALVTRVGNDATLYQDVISAADFPYASRLDVSPPTKISAFLLGISGIQNQLRLAISDGITTSYSSFHTGDGTQQAMTVVYTPSGSMQHVRIWAEVIGNNGGCVIGGFMLTVTERAPGKWQPLSREQVATATRTGLVSIVAQAIEGIKTFLKHPLFYPGASAGPAVPVSGRLTSSYADAGNLGAGEDVLYTYSLPAATLSEDGKVLRVTVWGTTANNANAKTIKLHFGGTVVASYGPAAVALIDWCLTATVIRSGAATQRALGLPTVSTVAAVVTLTAPGETLANAVTVKATGEGTADNDVVAKGWLVEVVG